MLNNSNESDKQAYENFLRLPDIRTSNTNSINRSMSAKSDNQNNLSSQPLPGIIDTK